MNIQDLQKLIDLESTATPGPWFVRQANDDACMSAYAISTVPAEKDLIFHDDLPSPGTVAACLMQSPPYVIPDDQRFAENAELIAAMRTALPELLRLAHIGIEAENGR